MERHIARKLVHPQCIALQLTIDADRLSGRQETRCPFWLGGYLERTGVELAVEPASAVVSRDADRPGAEIRFRDLRSERPVIIPDAIAAFLADRKSTRLNSSHVAISYAVFCLKKKIR